MGTSLQSNLPLTPRRRRAAGGTRALGGFSPIEWVDHLLAPWRGWQERRRAGACCREVLRLDRMLAAGQPWLPAAERHRKVVVAYMGCGDADAKALLACVQASFATWPVRRDLTLRDVAHYLAVSELLATRGESVGIRTSLKRVIDSTIPSGI